MVQWAGHAGRMHGKPVARERGQAGAKTSKTGGNVRRKPTGHEDQRAI